MGAVVDGAADAREQGGLGEWFFQEVDLIGEGTVGVQDRLGVSGHVQDGQGGADGSTRLATSLPSISGMTTS